MGARRRRQRWTGDAVPKVVSAGRRKGMSASVIGTDAPGGAPTSGARCKNKNPSARAPLDCVARARRAPKVRVRASVGRNTLVLFSFLEDSRKGCDPFRNHRRAFVLAGLRVFGDLGPMVCRAQQKARSYASAAPTFNLSALESRLIQKKKKRYQALAMTTTRSLA